MGNFHKTEYKFSLKNITVVSMEHIGLHPVGDLVETLALNTAVLAGHAGSMF